MLSLEDSKIQQLLKNISNMNKNDLSQDKRRPSDIFAQSQADQTEGEKYLHDTSQASGLFGKKRDEKAFLKSNLFKM